MTNWFRSLFQRSAELQSMDPLEPEVATATGIFRTLNLDEVMAAQTRWRKGLRDAIHDYEGGPLDIEQLREECRGPLGQWLASSGRVNYSHLPAFQELRQRHNEFHQCVGHILNLVQAGERVEAQRQMLTAFTQHSQEVLTALGRLRREASRQRQGEGPSGKYAL